MATLNELEAQLCFPAALEEKHRPKPTVQTHTHTHVEQLQYVLGLHFVLFSVILDKCLSCPADS